MTSRELVKATLEFRNTTDRAPRQLGTLPWTQINHAEELARIQSRYVWDIVNPQTVFTKPSDIEQGDPYVVGEYTDPWGCTFKNLVPGIMGEVKRPLLEGDEDAWDDISSIHIPEGWLSLDTDLVNKSCKNSDQFMMASSYPRPFEQLQFIRGTENLYLDLIDPPQGMLDFMEKMHDFYCRLLTLWARTDVDAIAFMDDWGAQNSLLINPTIWRRLFKPMYRDYIEIAHRYGKKAFMHSDGYILEILPDLIEIGLDAINSQIFCMGVDKLAPFKGKITFWGEICRQHILPNGTREEVEAAVASVYNTLWQNGGCIAQCEFGPSAKPENVDLVFQTWDRLTQHN